MTEISKTFEGMQSQLLGFETRVDGRLETFQAQMRAFEDRVDRKFAGVDQRLETFEKKFDALDGKMLKLFLFGVGIAVTLFTALFSAVLRLQ